MRNNSRRVRSEWPITIAHDYFTQRGGAERVAAALVDGLAPERIVTVLHEPDRTFPFVSGVPVETTFLQRFRAFRRDPRYAFPLIPLAWTLVRPVTAGVVVCSSSGWSHSIRTRSDARKIVYCHNPARWLYQPEDFFRGWPAASRVAAMLARPLFRYWDGRAARSADAYIANSEQVADRVRRIYHRDVRVIHPPIGIEPCGELKVVPGLKSDYFLTVGRGRGYKNVDALIEAFASMPEESLVVVGSNAPDDLPANVTFVGRVDDSELRWLYRGARALMSVSHEDFGLTPLEANACGTPSLVLGAGGFLESVNQGVSGEFISSKSPADIIDAVRAFPREWDSEMIRMHAASFSKQAFLVKMRDVIASL